jgi:hypothetical protein
MLKTLESAVNGWLLDSLILFFVFMAAYRLMKPKLTSFAKRVKSNLSRRRNNNRLGAGKGFFGPIVFSAICCGILAYAATRTPPPHPIYEYWDVKVISKVGTNSWLIEREDGKTLYKGCPDFDNGSVIWPGYVATRIKYEDFGSCNSILAPGLGFYWARDAQGNVRKIQ